MTLKYNSKTLLEYRTYSGLLDDVLPRYANVFGGTDFFNKMIVKNVLFGGAMYLNDGYLVNHEDSRRQLHDEDSLLRVMLRTGFIHIYTRTANAEALANMPVEMANQGNESFKRLVESPEWSTHGFGELWHRIAKAATLTGHVKRWPDKDTSVGFCRLYEHVALNEREPASLGFHGGELNHDDLVAIHDDFISREPQKSGPRDKYEKAALKRVVGKEGAKPESLSASARAIMHKLMTPANQAYHYNHGMALQSEDESISVDTMVGSIFAPILETTPVSLDQFRDFPVFSISTDLLLHDGSLFDKFCAPDTILFEAKTHYLVALERIIQGTGHLASLKTELREATENYSSRIDEHLRDRCGASAARSAIKRSFKLALESSEVGLGENDLNEALSLSLSADNVDGDDATDLVFVMENLSLAKEEVVEAQRTGMISVGDLSPHVACLTFNQDATKLYEQVPRAPSFK